MQTLPARSYELTPHPPTRCPPTSHSHSRDATRTSYACSSDLRSRDLGNLFPAVDNDDGSAYYWIASNVVAYGGFKNFLGNDKVWIHNLVLYPNGRTPGSGNGPCVMAWGGAHEVYENNTCVTRGAAGPGVDPYPWGVEGSGCDYANETMRPVLLHLSRNRYLSPKASYGSVCGRDLADLQALGEEVGSSVGSEPTVSAMMDMAARVLRPAGL
jgi:hypothetical protein